MDSGERWRLGHRPALDGLRGVAVVLVLVAHFGAPAAVARMGAGTVGVTVFFVLSGFLITALLLEERERSGRLDRRAFYVRRARRLLPALLACVALAIALELVVLGHLEAPGVTVATLTYTANFALAGDQWGTPHFLGHMWSLGIEEQFYLLWPFAVARLARRSRPVLVLGFAAAAAATPLRVLLWNDGASISRIWMGADTRSDGILIGCLLAFVLHRTGPWSPRRGWPAGGGLMLALLVSPRLSLQAVVVFVPLLAALAAAAMVYSAATTAQHPILASRAARWMGSRSYGIYLYHLPLAMALRFSGVTSIGTVWLVCLPATLVLAELSWRYIEVPFCRRSGHAEEVEVRSQVGRAELVDPHAHDARREAWVER